MKQQKNCKKNICLFHNNLPELKMISEMTRPEKSCLVCTAFLMSARFGKCFFTCFNSYV